MFQICILASGSKGNSAIIRTESTKIMLDAGLSGSKLTKLMQRAGLNEKKLDAVVISHEHSDHIAAAGIMCRRFEIPLYISHQTYSVCRVKLGKLPAGVVHIGSSDAFLIGDIKITTLPSSHDVVDGINFIFQKDGEPERKLAFATDLGFTSRFTMMKFKEASTVVLESNHDEQLLLNGPYPWHLKQRVKSNQGHLSNNQAVGFLTQIVHPGLKNIVLAHLSEKNNDPVLAENLMRDYLKSIRFRTNLLVASQYEPTELINI